MKRKILATMLALSTISVSNISAREFADIFCECGLGAMIAPNNPAVAAVTNVTWDLGTTAITSNISSPDSCMGGKEKTAAFIYQSYDEIEKDLAMGSGAYLDMLVTLAGLEEVEKEDFVNNLRKDFTTLVSNSSYEKSDLKIKSENLYNLLYKNLEA